MADERDAALELLGLVTNADLYKQRIAEYARAKTDADNATKVAQQARHEAEEFVRLADATRNQHVGQIAAAQTRHDQAAEEAARRIRLGNEQAAELLRLRAEITRQQAELDQREALVERAGKALIDRENALIARENDIASNEKDMARRRQKLAEAMG
jgi:hypothetical protein